MSQKRYDTYADKKEILKELEDWNKEFGALS